MELTPQQILERKIKDKDICENNPLEIFSSFKKGEQPDLVIKCTTRNHHYASVNPSVHSKEKTHLSGNPVKILNPNPSNSKLKWPTITNIIQEITTTLVNSPPKIHHFNPSPLTDQAIGLIHSLPSPNPIPPTGLINLSQCSTTTPIISTV